MAANPTLESQYPAQYAEWVAAGGIDNNFRAQLLGIGALAPTTADLGFLAGQATAARTQLENATAKVFGGEPLKASVVIVIQPAS